MCLSLWIWWLGLDTVFLFWSLWCLCSQLPGCPSHSHGRGGSDQILQDCGRWSVTQASSSSERKGFYLLGCLGSLEPRGAALGRKETAGTAAGLTAEHLRRVNGLPGLHSAIKHTYSFTELKTNPRYWPSSWGLTDFNEASRCLCQVVLFSYPNLIYFSFILHMLFLRSTDGYRIFQILFRLSHSKKWI